MLDELSGETESNFGHEQLDVKYLAIDCRGFPRIARLIRLRPRTSRGMCTCGEACTGVALLLHFNAQVFLSAQVFFGMIS